MIRRIELEGGYNVRDLGGYPTESGRSTSWQRLIRAGSLEKLSETAQQRLISAGVKTVIDLRNESEAEQYPSVFSRSPRVRYLNLPLFGDRLDQDEAWQTATQNYAHLHELYCTYLERCQPQFGAIIGAIAESPPATVFNCFAGKDRTGLVCALVLGAVGVPDEVIVEDYALSSQGLAELVVRWREHAIQNGQDMEHFEREVASEAHTMLETLSYLRRHYNDVPGYLRICGVTETQLSLLRTQLMD